MNRTLWAFFKRDLLNESSYRLAFLMQLLGSVHVVLIFFFISKMLGGARLENIARYGGNFFQFVILGVAVQQYLYTAINGFSGQMREAQLTGTLEAILVCPVQLRSYVAGSIAFSFVMNLVHVGVYLSLGALFGAAIPPARLPAITLVMLLSAFAFASFGILSAAYIVLFKKGNPLAWVVTLASSLLGGVYYPVSTLPDWLQGLSRLVPMTHCLEALRAAARPEVALATLASSLLALAAWVAVGLPLAYSGFAWAVKRARRTGSLGQY